ncbi:hypothetical protein YASMINEVIRUS_173 [Yasminevirus sp. GU-2018]|uniref:Uncharacterized protein n=1 Tax=Yasminevirus sp. GU-2018 TaxID=2420051 RepID=A0A5K0U7C7_9VIRU|nr:hypothetical protein YASMINEVIRUS_173 [Yasminevirus sp. GU-2018]
MGNNCSSFDNCMSVLKNTDPYVGIGRTPEEIETNKALMIQYKYDDMDSYMKKFDINDKSVMPNVNSSNFVSSINYIHVDTGCHEDQDGTKNIPHDVLPRDRLDKFQEVVDVDRSLIVALCFGKKYHEGNDPIIQRLIWVTVCNPENLNNKSKWATIKFTDEGDSKIPSGSQVFTNTNVAPLGNWDGVDDIQTVGPSYVPNTNPIRARAVSGLVCFTGDGITGATFKFTDILNYSDTDYKDLGFPLGYNGSGGGICQKSYFKGASGDFVNKIEVGFSNHQGTGSDHGGVKRVHSVRFLKLQTFSKAIMTVVPNKCCDTTVSRYIPGTVYSYACIFMKMMRGTDDCTRSFLDVCKDDLDNTYCRNYCDSNDCSEILTAYCNSPANRGKDVCSCLVSDNDVQWVDFKKKLQDSMGKAYADVLSAKPECFYDRCTQKGIKTKSMKESKCELSIQDCRNIINLDAKDATFKKSPIYNNIKNTCSQIVATDDQHRGSSEQPDPANPSGSSDSMSSTTIAIRMRIIHCLI